MTSGQLRVARIIAERDEIELAEAKDIVTECVECMYEDIDNSDQIVADLLGLEPDYIFDLLDIA